MRTAGKWITRILAIFVVIIIAGVVIFLIAGNTLIKYGVQRGASAALKVDVKLESVSLHPFAGKVELANLVVNNPAGYEIPNLMSLGAGKVAVKLGSLMSNTIDIDYVVLDNIDLSIEQKGLSTNLNDVIKALPKSPEQAQSQEAKPGKKLRIKTLEINNVNVTLKLLPIPGKVNKITLKLAPIKMTDLGSDNKMDMAALSAKILAALAAGVAQQGAGLIPDSVTGPLKSGLGEMKGLMQNAGTQTSEMGKGILEQGQKAGKNLFGIFKKDANSTK